MNMKNKHNKKLSMFVSLIGYITGRLGTIKLTAAILKCHLKLLIQN